MKRFIMMAVLFFGLVSIAVAAPTPGDISKTYFEMMKTQKWDEIAKLYDPQALKDFREMLGFLNDMPEETSKQFFAQFFGSDITKDNVAKLSDTDFFSRFLKAILGQAAQLGQLNFNNVEILGSVKEGDNIEHVVTRSQISLGDINIESMEIVSFKKNNDEWKILLQGKMKGMAQQIKKMLQKK